MYLQTHTVVGTADGSGNVTVYLGPVNGLVVRFTYTETTATSADYTVTGETSGVTVLAAKTSVTATTSYVLGQDLTGPTATNPYAMGVPIAGERLKIVCANVTATKDVTFTAHVWGGAA
jgi:hypothetical protein